MDCCNYVQPYSTAGHHHYYHHQQMQQHQLQQQQQQHHLQQQQMQMQMQHHQQQQQHQFPAQQYCYEAAAANAYAPAYNAAIEARYNCRLPPAYPTDYVYNPKEARLRKAMREQSRTQQPAVNGPVSSRPTTATGASNGQQPVSPLPGGGGGGGSAASTIGGANRIIGPWFPLGHTGSSAPPQPAAAAAAPATHPKPILSPRVMAAHQRTLDKTKDVIRKQLQDCTAATGPFPTGPSAYPVNGGAQESSSDYAGDFAAAEGQQQKWHPYQNGVSAYHSRGALMSKMNSLHRGMQNTAPHPNPRAWGQFCNVPFPTSQSVMMQQQQQQRSNRHMVFLQEQQQQQQSQQQSHCGYPTAEMQMSYEAKMQDDLARRLHSSYSQEEQQVKTPLMELQLSQLPAPEEQKTEDPPRWTTTPRPPSSSSSCTPDGLLESESTPTTQVSKQPLPGFQQAFGSTEIGRFSRSELFASLVEAVNVSSKSEEQPSQFDSGRSSSPDYSGYNGQGSPVMPSAHTWHSPYAGAIGSEI